VRFNRGGAHLDAAGRGAPPQKRTRDSDGNPTGTHTPTPQTPHPTQPHPHPSTPPPPTSHTTSPAAKDALSLLAPATALAALARALDGKALLLALYAGRHVAAAAAAAAADGPAVRAWGKGPAAAVGLAAVALYVADTAA
jgi:hypothetical protein